MRMRLRSGSVTRPPSSDSSGAARCRPASGSSCSGPRAARDWPRCSSGWRSARGVIAVVAGEAKRELCATSGAEVIIDRTLTSVRDAVLEATRGGGVDLVYDPVGGALAASAARCLRSGGRLLAVGFASGRWVDADIAHLVLRNASIVGVYAGGQTRMEAEADHELLLGLSASGRLGGVTRTVSFDELPDALDAVDRAEALGKLVVNVSDVHS